MKNALVQSFSKADLEAAWQLERGRLKSTSYGIDGIGGKQFDAEKSWRIPAIRNRLQPKFSPSALIAIAKLKDTGGHRIICIPTIEDRLIQFSILHKIRGDLTRRGLLNTISYGLVAHSNRTVQDARERATELRAKGAWVYKADIEKFFDNIPRDILATQIRAIVPQRSLHEVLIKFSTVEIGNGFSPEWEQIVSGAGIVKGVGVRQGMPLSPYFAGMILRDLDCLLEKKGYPVIRYVDDIIGFFQSEGDCQDFHGFLSEQLKKINLTLGIVGAENSKTKIYGPEDAVDFIGMQMFFDANGKCHLRVSDRTLENIEGRFGEMTKLDKLLQKQITLPHLGGRLEAMKKGYIAAYHGASNMSELKLRVNNACAPVISTVLEELFGPTIKTLGVKQRKFLGLAD